MKEIRTTRAFLRDLKLAGRRGKSLVKIEALIESLAQGKKLAPRHRPHRLKGQLAGLWECHIEPDWLLLWEDGPHAITLVRCGTHADLFD